MNKLLNVSSSPHVRCSVNTQNLMLDVVIAMLPAAAFGVYNFGFHALLVLLVTSAVCVASEYVYEKLMHKPITIADGSALVTGMILALNMPPQIPVWVPALGGIFAIIVVKQLYGGLGQNFMNPALAARCFLLISFAGMMNNFSAASLGFDSVSGATPLAAMRAGQSVDLASMFIGRIPGTIGEVSTIALLIGGIYLLVRKVISWRIPVIYIGTVAVFVFIFGGFDGFPRTIPQAEALENALNAIEQKLDYAIDIDVPDENIINRMSGRRACVGCGATYHVLFNPTKVEGKCDVCGESLILRDDDKPETVKKRLDVYHTQTQPLIDFYTERKVLVEVDGTQSMDKVFDDIMKILGE